MSDYGDSINTLDYIYRRPVYYINPYSTYKTNVVVKLVLNEDNFNFNLANDDGSDFRLLDYTTGMGVLKMWLAYWNKTGKYAVLFFKVPEIAASASVTFTAYWGNPSATDVSDPDSLGFLLYESFDSAPLSSSKWVGNLSQPLTDYGYRLPSQDSFTSITDPLSGIGSWMIEAGVYPDFDEESYSLTQGAFGFGLVGTENDFDIRIMPLDRIKTNAEEAGGGTYNYSIKTSGGLEGYCYQDVYVAYIESTDEVIVKLLNRETFDDVTHTIGRKVEGDTRPVNLTVYGRTLAPYQTGGYPTYMSWLAVREYDGTEFGALDGSALYVEYETVNHQNQDFREYSGDITSVQCMHETTFGGNPYLLSDNGYDADTNIWKSDDGATATSGIAAIIHTVWGEDVTNRTYTHYDSGHTYYYNACKLSDADTDRMNRDYWQSTTTSGWAAIKFPTSRVIGAFRIKGTTVSGAIPKDYIFYGSDYNPVLFLDRAKEIKSGTFYKTSEWQAVVLNNSNPYKYYILYVENTYENENIEIQEWEMMDSLGPAEKKYVGQLRLHPALFGNLDENFPKEISLQGSTDGFNWSTILSWTSTYTPFIKHIAEYGYWQRYSFDNVNGYFSFKLLCRDNWLASDGKIVVGEWSMHELASEAYTYRILAGATNNIQQIWALPTCGIDDAYNSFFIANDKLNKISNNKIISYEDLPAGYIDFNVV